VADPPSRGAAWSGCLPGPAGGLRAAGRRRRVPGSPGDHRPAAGGQLRPASGPELEALRNDTFRALEIADEQAEIRAMSRGELEAQVLEADRAHAAAPPDTSSQLRLTAQAEADAWRQSADAEAEHGPVRAENARSLATALAAEKSRLETANARYEEWSARTASTREKAGKAKAELQRREQGPSAGGAPGPRSMATWWREFQAHADAVDLAIEREHQAAIRDGQPWPPERTPEAGHEESATAAPGRESQLGQAQSGVSSPLAGPEPSAPEPGTPESEAAGPVPPMTGAPPGWISCRPARTKRRRGSTRSGQKSRPAASTPRGSNARPRPDRRLTGRWKRPTKWNCKRSGRTGVTFKSHDTWIHTP